MKITSTCLLACATAALLSGAHADLEGYGPPTGTFSEAGGMATIKTSDVEGSAFSASVQTSFTGEPVSGAGSRSRAGLSLVNPKKFKSGYGSGEADTAGMGAAGGFGESAFIASEAGTEGKVFQSLLFPSLYESSGTADSAAMGAAMGENKVGQTVDGSFVDGDSMNLDGNGVEFFGFSGSMGITAGAEYAEDTLEGAAAIQGVNDATFDILTSTVPITFPFPMSFGRKLQETFIDDLLVVGSEGGAAVNVKDGGTATSGQINVASAADLPDFGYRGTQSKSLAAASVGPEGNPFVVNGAEAGGSGAAGNECIGRAFFFGVDGKCDQFAESGQGAIAANENKAVGVMAEGAAKGMNERNFFDTLKASQAGNINIVDTSADNTGFAVGGSFGTAAEGFDALSLTVGTGLQAAEDFDAAGDNAVLLLEEVGVPPFDNPAFNVEDFFLGQLMGEK